MESSWRRGQFAQGAFGASLKPKNRVRASSFSFTHQEAKWARALTCRTSRSMMRRSP